MQLLALYFNLLNMMVMCVKAHSIGNLWYKLSNWPNTLFVPISFRKKTKRAPVRIKYNSDPFYKPIFARLAI